MPPLARNPSDAAHVIVAVNPHAGAGAKRHRIDCLVDWLRAHRYEVEVSDDRPRVIDLAQRRWATGELRALVAAGGDGTLSALVNDTEPGMPICVLPLGTENLIARHFHLAGEPTCIGRAIHTGHTLKLDAGRANGRLFLVMVSAGFDAEVVRRLAERRTGHITRFSYAKPLWETLRSYQYPEMRLYCSEPTTESSEVEAITARWAFVFNLPCYARDIALAPDADGTDGQLDVCTFGRPSLLRGLGYLAAVLGRRHQQLSDCVVRRTSRLRIESDGPVAYQMDGDYAGCLPLDVDLIERRVTLIVPEPFSAASDGPAPP